MTSEWSGHRVVCVTACHPHEHVVALGTGPTPFEVQQIWTVAEVRDAIAWGERFYTVGRRSGAEADIEATVCREPGCLVETVRSVPSASADSDLSSLPSCSAVS